MTLTLERAPASNSAPERDRSRARLSHLVLLGGTCLTAALFVLGGWERRWIADDGLTVLRTVRNLLAGHGPVFNAGERVEVNTSTAWTYLLAFCTELTGARMEYVALGVALTLSAAAVVFAMLGTARLWGRSRLLFPAGILVYIAVPPARDYATSGLESSLVICWLAVLWWGLTRWCRAARPGAAGVLALAFVAGLAPLIRPELTVIGAASLLVICGAATPGTALRPWAFRSLIVAAAGLAPVAHQVWRMGYYALPYPNTAVAKDASGAKWRQGLLYLWDFTGPYRLWVPLLLLGAAGLILVYSARTGDGKGRVESAPAGVRPAELLRGARRRLRGPGAVVSVMVAGSILLTGYEIRVGGDFMHGRMLLPALFCALLPVAVLPATVSVAQADSIGDGDRRTRLGRTRFATIALRATLIGTIGWASLATGVTAIDTPNRITAAGIADERGYYIRTTGRAHPIRAEDYLGYPRIRAMLRDIANTPGGGLLVNTPDWTWQVIPPAADPPAPHTVYFINLGMISMNTPLHVRVLDPMGLAYPLAAHSFRFPDARIGHDKNLDTDWVIADSGAADRYPALPPYIGEDWVTRIHTALTCPKTRDLLASTRAPLTRDRFLRNLTHAFDYAAYRIDRVPEHELARCALPDPIPPAHQR
ncbi:flagellar motor control protein ZomB [Nocardia sp. NPDC057668]|uniref:flagellar motor control protein ZomB n=1 Tax=Nocardia sp. NPDC057668 TaxID=3346202 RepID=UPI00366B93B1